MKTAITVRKKDGTLWAATSVFLTMVDGDANGAMQMNYVCSGILRSCPLADKALLQTAKGVPLGADPMQMDLTILKDVFIDAASSDTVERCLFKCMERVSYQDVKVTPALFDDVKLGEQSRGDLLEIYWKVIEVNCAPFFVKAFSVLKARLASGPAAPKSQ